jgi:hypothetical protein
MTVRGRLATAPLGPRLLLLLLLILLVALVAILFFILGPVEHLVGV